MTVDYAKRPTQNREPGRLASLIFVLTLLLLAAGALFALKIHEQRLHQKNAIAAVKPAPVAKADNDTQKNQFDFYSILPKTQKT